MKLKPVAWLAWTLCALLVALALLALGLEMAGWVGQPLGLSRLIDTLYSVLVIPFAVIASFIITRQPRNVIGWLLLLPAAVAAIDPLIIRYLAAFPEAPPVISLPLFLLIWYSGWSWVVVVFPVLLIPLYFPTGRPPSARWRWAGPAMAVQALAFIGFTLFTVQIISTIETVTWSVANPIGFLSNDQLEALVIPWVVALVVLTFLCVASLFVRYRRADAVERTQIKWLLYACGLFALLYISGLFLPLDTADGARTPVGYAWDIAFFLGIAAIYSAIAIAILRYRLWDIDVLIRRTLIYTVLTAILALIYFGSVLLVQPLLAKFTGQNTQLTTVLFTLLIAALFAPVRRWVQAVIDRRFYRRKYDAAHTLALFAAGARDETDLEQLTAHLGRAVEQSVEPAHVGLWLKAPPKSKP